MGVRVRDPWRTQLNALHGDESLTAACVSGNRCECVLPWCIQYRYWNSCHSHGIAYVCTNIQLAYVQNVVHGRPGETKPIRGDLAW